MYHRKDLEKFKNYRQYLNGKTDSKGHHWVLPVEALRKFDFGRDSLSLWVRQGCPFLHNRKLRARRFPIDENASPKLFLLESDLLSVMEEAVAQAGPEQDHNWLTYPRVRQRFGCWNGLLNSWADVSCPWLRGRPLSHPLLAGVTIWNSGELEAINRAMKSEVGPEWLSEKKAYVWYGFSAPTLDRWREKSCSYLEGRTLTARPHVVAFRRSEWEYRLGELQVIHETIRSRRRVEAPYRDDDGIWVSGGPFCRNYPEQKTSLRQWRLESCKHLGGEPIRAKLVFRLKRANKPGLVWLYHRDDLRKIAEQLPRAEFARKGDALSGNGPRGMDSKQLNPMHRDSNLQNPAETSSRQKFLSRWIKLNPAAKIVNYVGKDYHLPLPGAFALFESLFEADGAIVPGAKLRKVRSVGSHIDRFFKKHLPKELHALIQSKKGNEGGYWIQIPKNPS